MDSTKIPEARPGRSFRATLAWLLAIGVFLAGQGILFLALGAWVGDGLPYQDGSAELLRQQQQDIERHWELVKTALVVAAVSSVWLAVKVVRSRAARGLRETSRTSRRRC